MRKQKQKEKIEKKTIKVIGKISNSKKIVLSKKMKKEEKYINYLNEYGIEIADGRWLFEILLTDIVNYIVEKQKIERVNISVLINDLTDKEFENIKLLAQKYTTINKIRTTIARKRNNSNNNKQ